MRSATCLIILGLVQGILLCMGAARAADWAAVPGHLMTRWAEDVSPENALPEYPRPMMVRERWLNLNGLWDYALQPRDAKAPETYAGKILVPYPVESALSGVKQPVGKKQRVWYHRSFEAPADWAGQRVLLHFGAVDWEATVWVNGTEIGSHRGGYDAFHFDITGALRPAGSQEIVVAVWDPTDDGYQPRGKQVNEPRGIWYTAVTGIWQTVWLEPVPMASIAALKSRPDLDAGALRLSTTGRNLAADDVVEAKALDTGKVVATAQGKAGGELTLALENPKRWSPDSPFLYDLEISLKRGDTALDTVKSYFGMRTIEMSKDEHGVNRLLLNGKPLFHFGPLDQGWWPDGLYTAATDEALRYDVDITRKMGFNAARKHVKIEPARWYYHCDRAGLMVWQDMPSGDTYIGGDDPDITRSPESRAQFLREYQALIDGRGNHPCIVMWVVFNEGWGQFETNEMTQWTKDYDPSRLVNQTSGWADRGGSDVHDKHSYPGPAMFPLEAGRASVLGEFGGLGLPVEGHLWWDKRNWGYRNLKNQDDLRDYYEDLIFRLRPLIGQGLAAAIYTQTSDVEGEVNGLMTYDRAMVKMGADWLGKVNATVYLPPPVMETVVPTSEAEGRMWRYTLEKPAKGWQAPDFDDSAWKEGPGVFGTEGTPGAAVRTTWDTKDIWLRRTFELPEAPLGELRLMLHHDEDAEVYVNGVLAAKEKEYTAAYVPVRMSLEARKALKPGANTFAIHCRQTKGGQCIDAGLVLYKEQS